MPPLKITSPVLKRIKILCLQIIICTSFRTIFSFLGIACINHVYQTDYNPSQFTDEKNTQSYLPFLIFQAQKTERNILQLIHKAQKSIEISLYGLENQAITNALIEAHLMRSVHLRMSSELDQAGTDNWQKLLRHGVPIRFGNSSGIMHNKYMIVDRKYIVTGSANWTEGLFSHFNNTMIINSEVLAEEYLQDFNLQFTGYYANKKDEGYSHFLKSIQDAEEQKEKAHWNFTSHSFPNDRLVSAYFTPYKDTFPEYTQNPGLAECSLACLASYSKGSGPCPTQACSHEACYKKREGGRNKIVYTYPNYDAKGIPYCTEYDNAMNIVLRLLQSAQHSILILAFAFRDRLIYHTLIEAQKKGLDVQVWIDHNQYRTARKSNRKSYAVLSEKLKTFRICEKSNGGLLHHKVIVIDKNTILLGSLNFSQSAVSKNDENFIIIQNVHSLAHDFYREASRINSDCYSLTDTK